MIEKDKQLLLKDLCARLPYGVNILWEKNKGITLVGILLGITTIGAEMDNSALRKIPFDKLKPYLRPMSSMTKEEMKEYYDGYYTNAINLFTIPNPQKTDWLNAHHFDYRGLIPMGLALEATEGMYR